MSSLFNVHCVNTLPASLDGDTFYFVKDGAEKMSVTATNPDGTTAYRTHTSADILAMIATGVGGVNHLGVVATLSDLEPLEADGKVKYVVVADATTGSFKRLDPITMVPTTVTGDDTITSTTKKNAWYVYSPTDGGWLKTGEGENLDTVLDFSELTGIENVLTAIAKMHEHTNAAVLNALSDVGGDLYYGGNIVSSVSYTNNWA